MEEYWEGGGEREGEVRLLVCSVWWFVWCVFGGLLAGLETALASG